MNAGRLRTVLGVLLADARRHKLQTAATCLGVAVGVAVIVAIRLASESALGHFKDTVRTLTGQATHELVARQPLPAARLTTLLASPGVRAAQPVVTSTLLARDVDDEPLPLRLVGVDPFLAPEFLDLDETTVEAAAEIGLFLQLMQEPGLVAVAQRTLDAVGLPDGGTLTVRGPHGELALRTVGVDSPSLGEADPPFALADLATAQELLHLGERVTRFELVLEDDAPALALEAGERLQRPDRRGERADSMTEAFRLNLMCLGFLAVLVGAFLAYNMAQFAVVRRRPLLGRLRCLGCNAGDLLRAVLLEAAVLGGVGSLLGLGLGTLLSRLLVEDVARTVSTLYGRISTPVPELDPLTAGLALAVGTLATVAATWTPARSAARTPPALVAGRRRLIEPLPARWTVFALLFGSAALLLPRSAVVLPAVAVLGTLLAAAAALPHLLGRVVRRSPRLPVLALAFGRIHRSLGRAGSAAGALAMPLAMTIAILVMVGSFRAEVSSWSQAILGADIYLSPRFVELQPEVARLPEALLDELEELPGVTAVDRLRLLEEDQGPRGFLVAGSPLATPRARGSLRVLSGGTVEELLARLDEGDAMVSEPLSRRLDLGPGDTLTLQGQDGPVERTVAGVFQDFSYDRGYAMLSEADFLSIYGETGVRSGALLLEPDVDGRELARRLTDRYPDVEFRDVARLREEVIVAFDDTFAITYVLQAISTALALVGILTALLCLHLERRAELGVLRALGARHRTVGQLLLSEALVLLGSAGVLAVPTGLALAWILVSVVNTRSFGWSFPMQVEAGPVAGLLGLALVAGLLAGCVPWWMVRRAAVADLLEDGR